MGYAIILLLSPWRYNATGGIRTDGGIEVARIYYLLGVAGNAAIVALYLATRTVGIPLFGPEAGEVEPVGVIDVISKVAELTLIAVLLRLYRLAPAEGQD